MTAIPWSDNKNARQVYREYVELWGFTYEGDTSDGHHVFRYPPTGQETTLAHSPSAGWSWVKARRAEAAKITGKPFRGKRDTHKARAKAARERTHTQHAKAAYQTRVAQADQEAVATHAVEIARAARRDGITINSDELWGLAWKRYLELRSIQSLMGARGSIF